MIKWLKSIFRRRSARPEDYKGFSDFFLHAPDKVKQQVIREAAQKANEDQLKVFEEAKLKMVGTR